MITFKEYLMNEAKLGRRIEYTNYSKWKRDLPPKVTFNGEVRVTAGKNDRSIETASTKGDDPTGICGVYNHEKNSGWIYEYYLGKEPVNETTLQSIVKRNMHSIGSMLHTFGDVCEEACGHLMAKPEDPCYEMKAGNPQADAARRSIVGGRPTDDQGTMRLVALTGSRKVLVWKRRVLTSKNQFDSLVDKL
jgi:hypothetical protein